MTQRYIVGDVVMYNNEVQTIVDNYVSNTYELDSIYYPVNWNELSGVPITPEILEKNGWKLCHGFYCSPNEEGAGVCLSSETGYVWDAYLGRQPLRSNINSVSDLQHLLFGLGLNSEMEV